MLMYFQKEKGKTNLEIFFIGILKVTDEKSRIRSLIRQRYGTADPDPYQNVTDMEHCLKQMKQGTLYVEEQ